MLLLVPIKLSSLPERLRFLSKSLLLGFLLYACTGNDKGKLHILASGGGAYEIYKIASEAPLQLSSEFIGKYNEDMELSAGSYLILADCSSELVVIKSRRRTTLVADHITFLPPTNAEKVPDSFIIQCTRHEKTQTRQRLVNQFALNIIRGSWELLVGMSPLKLEAPKQKDTPQVSEYQLSALRIASFAGMTSGTRFFVSPLNSIASVTESQKLGDWLFLPAGEFNVELNGSAVRTTLAVGEMKSIDPAFLKVATPPEANLSLANSIEGNPLFVEINGGHWLNLNETYPVLPGKATLRLVGSESSHEIELIGGAHLEKRARSVQVNLSCPPWDWTCLGSRKIYLYQKDAHYPFAKGLSDVPLLFFEEDAWLTLEGSREIRFNVRKDKSHVELDTAVLKLHPKVEYKAGIITDLVRVESAGSDHASGNTLDLSLDSPSTVFLLPGTFSLVEYITSTNMDGERRKSARKISIRSNETLDLEFVSYLSEKKFRSLAKQTPTSEQIRRSARRRLVTQKYRMPWPLEAM